MMIMRKTIFLIFAVLFLAIPASAVLNEKNLGQTLAVLREELEMYQRDSRRSIVLWGRLFAREFTNISWKS